MIEKNKYLFSKMELADYDIVIPFVCRRDGCCCRTYMPHIPEKDLSELADYLGRQPVELFREYMACLRKNATLDPGPCIFLSTDCLCLIYRHPLRPPVCYLYPFSYGTKVMACGGYRDHDRIVNAFLSRQSRFGLYDSSFCPNLNCRPIPDREWESIRNIMEETQPSEAMRRAFTTLNGRPE